MKFKINAFKEQKFETIGKQMIRQTCIFSTNVIMHLSLTDGIKMLIRIVLCREPLRALRHRVAHKSSWKAQSKVDSRSFAAAFEFADRLRGISFVATSVLRLSELIPGSPSNGS